MKKLVLLLTATCFFFNLKAQEKTVDTLITKAITAVKTDDEKIFLSLFPTYEQMVQLFTEAMGDAEDSSTQKRIKQLKAEFTRESFEAEILSQTREEFRKCLESIRKKSVEPRRLEFVSADYAEERPKGMPVHMKMASGTIHLKADSGHYELPFVGVVWSESQKGWFGISFRSFRKQGEREEIEELEEIEKDIVTDTTVTVEEIIEEAPPPPPPPDRPKQKKKAEKPAARKPGGKG